ncbi:MAG: outer membrane beta-barrel protein [Gammaproteobacteria bacterium]|nr:outer membrane beta-barrel protein [Gammaproteobacteria bacterium]
MKKALKLCLAPVIAMSVNAAFADSGQWYVGVGAGQSKYNNWASQSDMAQLMDMYGATLGVDDFDGTQGAYSDDNDIGFSLFAGYTINPMLAVELSYTDLGEVDGESHASGTFYDAVDNSLEGDLNMAATAAVDVMTLDVKLSYAVDPVVLFAKIGIYSAETELNVDADSSLNGEAYRYSVSDDSTGVHFGFGFEVPVTDPIAFRAQWERNDAVEANSGESSVDLLSAALIYKF